MSYSQPPGEAPDSLTPHGAKALAQRIADYWASQGKAVRVWTVPVGMGHINASNFAVRSDLRNGLPR